MRRSRYESQPILTSLCGDIRIRGTAGQLVAKHEAIAYEAEREKDFIKAHNHFQCADHYKKVLKGEIYV